MGVPHDVRLSICVAESLGQLQAVAWTVNTLARHHLHMQPWCARSHAHAQKMYLLSSPEKKSYSAELQVPSASSSVQTEAPAAAEYVPAGHVAHVAAAAEVAPIWPYLPTAHREPEHVEAPVICTNTYINIHTYIYIRILYSHTPQNSMHFFCLFAKTQTHTHTHTHTHWLPVHWVVSELRTERAHVSRRKIDLWIRYYHRL